MVPLLKSSRLLHRFALLVAIILIVLSGVTLALGFAEEPLTFLDPVTGTHADEEISTIHDDLTYAMALAAGFSITDSVRLQIWDQLVDSEELGPGATISYTNCTGAFKPTPDPALVCPAGTDTADVVWPMWATMKNQASCVTSRFGPYSPFFHFPHQNARELGALHDWGWGITNTLIGYSAYAWDGPTVLQANCTYTQTEVISTTIAAGSLEAFATYLHSLGDSYSHRDCLAALDTMGAPWGTHTVSGTDACDYLPNNPNNTDAHGREFGSAFPHDSDRTVDGILAIYEELVSRSRTVDGIYYPIHLDQPFTGVSGATTLREALSAFVHNWPFQPPIGDKSQNAVNRRNLAAQIAAAALAQRQTMRRIYLPALLW